MACRLCLYIFQENDINISSISTEEHVSGDYVLALSLIQELNLELSQEVIICKTCLETLKIFHDFVETCKGSEQKLSLYKKKHGPIQDLTKVANMFFMDCQFDNLPKTFLCCICFKNDNFCQPRNLLDEPFLVKFLKDVASIKEMLSISLPVLCKQCTVTLEELYNFKCTCIMTQDGIKCYYNKVNRLLKNEDMVIVAKRQGVKQKNDSFATKHVTVEKLQKCEKSDTDIGESREVAVDLTNDCKSIPGIEMAVDKRRNLKSQITESENDFVNYANDFSISNVFTVNTSGSISNEVNKSDSNKGKNVAAKVSSLKTGKCKKCGIWLFCKHSMRNNTGAGLEKNEIDNTADVIRDHVAKTDHRKKENSTEHRVNQCAVGCMSRSCSHSLKSDLYKKNNNNTALITLSDTEDDNATNRQENLAGDGGTNDCEQVVCEDLTLDDNRISVNVSERTDKNVCAKPKHVIPSKLSQCQICYIWGLCVHSNENCIDNSNKNNLAVKFAKPSLKPYRSYKRSRRKYYPKKQKVKPKITTNNKIVKKDLACRKAVCGLESTKLSYCRLCGIWGLCKEFKEGCINSIKKNYVAGTSLNSYKKSKKKCRLSRNEKKKNKVPNTDNNVESVHKDSENQKTVHDTDLEKSKDLRVDKVSCCVQDNISTDAEGDALNTNDKCKTLDIHSNSNQSPTKNLNDSKNHTLESETITAENEDYNSMIRNAQIVFLLSTLDQDTTLGIQTDSQTKDCTNESRNDATNCQINCVGNETVNNVEEMTIPVDDMTRQQTADPTSAEKISAHESTVSSSDKSVSVSHQIRFLGREFTCTTCRVTSCKHSMKRHLDNEPNLDPCDLCYA